MWIDWKFSKSVSSGSFLLNSSFFQLIFLFLCFYLKHSDETMISLSHFAQNISQRHQISLAKYPVSSCTSSYLLQNTRTSTQLSHCYFITRIVFSPFGQYVPTLSETPTEWPIPSIFVPNMLFMIIYVFSKKMETFFQLSFFSLSPHQSCPSEVIFMAILTFSSMYQNSFTLYPWPSSKLFLHF